MSEHDANQKLSDTARMRGLDALRHDPLEDTQPMTLLSRRMSLAEARKLYPPPPRERRKPSTIGARAPETHRLDAVSERDQSAIESGIWPRYEP